MIPSQDTTNATDTTSGPAKTATQGGAENIAGGLDASQSSGNPRGETSGGRHRAGTRQIDLGSIARRVAGVVRQHPGKTGLAVLLVGGFVFQEPIGGVGTSIKQMTPWSSTISANQPAPAAYAQYAIKPDVAGVNDIGLYVVARPLNDPDRRVLDVQICFDRLLPGAKIEEVNWQVKGEKSKDGGIDPLNLTDGLVRKDFNFGRASYLMQPVNSSNGQYYLEIGVKANIPGATPAKPVEFSARVAISTQMIGGVSRITGVGFTPFTGNNGVESRQADPAKAAGRLLEVLSNANGYKDGGKTLNLVAGAPSVADRGPAAIPFSNLGA